MVSKWGCDLLSNLYLWTIENNRFFLEPRNIRVVICFQICIFGPLKTTQSSQDNVATRCDLLSNLYLWTIENNKNRLTLRRVGVVICFQICIFGPLKTTEDCMLSIPVCCDLLSNLYLWTIENNWSLWIHRFLWL